MKAWKEAGALVLTIAVLAVGAGFFSWYTSRPMVLDPAELTQAETVEDYPGAELSLEVNGSLMELTFSNHSDARLESGASVDGERNLSFGGGLQVLLDGQWYEVPSEPYATAGVGLELEPGDSVSGQYSLSPYGQLPDGQYRIALGYWQRSPGEKDPLLRQPYHQSYARFDVESGHYMAPEG